MHLAHTYKKQFELVDKIIIYLNYESDLSRGEYQPNYNRINMLNSTIFKIRDNIKLLAYGSKIGILEPLKRMVQGKAFNEPESGFKTNDIELSEEQRAEVNEVRLQNFKSLVELYGFDNSKTAILLDSRKTSKGFMTYCKAQKIDIIDFSKAFENSKKPTTLIYDKHWNDHGRTLIAQKIVGYLKKKQ